MMLCDEEPRVLVVTALLMAVREGYDRYRLRSNSRIWYDLYTRQRGREFKELYPSEEAVQVFPAVLASLAGEQGWWAWCRRWVRRRLDGEEFGAFQFSVGDGSVGVGYRVQWMRGSVAELDIAVATSNTLAAAAHRELLANLPVFDPNVC